MLFRSLLAFLIGGRLLGMILLYRVYVQDPLRILIVWDGIFNIVGGCIGFSVSLLIFTWRQRKAFLRWVDVLIPSMSLILAFDWLGRFFGSLSYGMPTDVLWGVTYESMSVRYTVPIHPVQLYYALWFFALTVLLLKIRKREVSAAGPMGFGTNSAALSSSHTGLVTLVGVLLSCVAVILFEFLRGDFAVTVFAKFSDFFFLALLFMSLGALAAFERKMSHRYSLINGSLVGLGTIAYLLLRPWITVVSVEWRLSQFLAVLAVLSTIVYVVVHRWKYPHL